MTSETQSIQLIPLNKLVASPRNVRRKDRKANIDALAASIASCGLLQNLCVVPDTNGRFEVDAGGRRLLALKHLAKAGTIARDFPVPCHVIASEAGREISLIENIHRVGMDAMDEVEAYAALIAEGMKADEIARRFGVTRRHVDQRLALAGLSPRIKTAWKRGDVNLEAARAFCVVDDHDQQDAVFRSLSRPITHPASVRARLMEGRMPASDRLALCVGLEAYEKAGGVLVRDLFDEDAVYIADPALMTQLAERKLDASRDTYIAEGWGWVDIHLGSGANAAYASTRLHPSMRAFTAEEQAELDRLSREMEALDDALDQDGIDDDPRWERRDDLAGAIETIRQAARVWDSELIAHAGVVLAIGHDGDVTQTLGVVRQSDEKTIRATRKRREAAEFAKSERDGQAPDAHDDEAEAGSEDRLPKGVIRDLSLVRTRALRLLISQNPNTALAVAVAGMVSRAVFCGELSGVGVTVRATHVDDLEGLAQGRGILESCLPTDEKDVLGWCLQQDRETLLRTLAVLVAGSIDLSHEKGMPADRRKQDVADELATALDLDMRAYWTADADYWMRLSKADLLAALSEAPEIIDFSSDKRDALIKAHAKLKKDDLAAKLGKAFEGSGYLPDLLVTQPAAGSFALTETAANALAA